MTGHAQHLSALRTSTTYRSAGYCVLFAVLLAVSPLEAVVISEIHYHPPLEQEQLEFLEITNDASSPEDISGWAFVEGIRFEFPSGSILRGGESLVVCADVDALRSHYGIDNAVGNYEGKLDGSGERLTLVNHVGIVMESLRYRDRGKWPVAPDGTGHSLALKSLSLDTAEPESWTQSQELGGSPGHHDGETVLQTICFNELFRSASVVPPPSPPADGGWVELYNAGAAARDVSGWRLADNPERDDPHVFPAGTTIPAGGFLVVEELTTTLRLSAPVVQVFLADPQGLVEAALTFDRAPADGLVLGEYSEALFPDGGSPDGGTELWVTPTSTPGSSNEVPRVTDLVINEIFYHPPEDRDGEFLELFNRGAEELDLAGFSFAKGIEYTFAAGTSLGPGAYLVLADDPQIIEERYGLAGALGWSRGVLSNGGENLRLVDPLGNLVDEVRYFEGGEWPIWADGRGASLELIDPDQDNDFGAAWGASDETEKSVWEEHSFEVPKYEITSRPELHLLLVERGVCRIDDVSIVETPEGDVGNFIPNSGFEEDTRGWLIGGTHVHSERITHDAHSGEACLEVVATSKGDDLCNRIETETEPSLEPGRAYEVSLWTRWLRGSSLLVVHGEFSAGSWPGERDVNLSGNPLAARIRMSVPRNLGTPGAENSLRLALREATGSDNLGPVMMDVVHAPASPVIGLPVAIRACVSDSDGVASVRVFFREDVLENAQFQSVELLENADAERRIFGGSSYVGEIPSLSEERRQVAFYVEATDARGAVTRFPSDAPERTLAYRTETRGVLAQFERFPDLQVFLSAKSKTTLAARPATSNDLVDATVVFDDEQIYYTVGVRYRGSPWHRPEPLGIRVRFGDDQRFRDRLRDINLSNLDLGNAVGYFLLGLNGTAEKPIAVADYKYINVRFNGNSVGKPGLYEPIDKDFIERWYGADAARDGVAIKANGRRRFTDGCDLDGWDETTLRHRDANPENYRFYWTHSIHQTRDNWQPLIDGTRILDAANTPDAEFDRLFESVVDVEAFLRVLIPRILMNDGDALFWGNGHNGQLFWEPSGGRWQYIAFDFGGGFRSVPANLLALKDENVRRIVTHPRTLRLYYRLIHEYLQCCWSVEAAGPFLDALEAAAGVGESAKSFIRLSRGNFELFVRPFVTAEFRILTNNGEDFAVETPDVNLQGEAPVLVTSFQLRTNDGTPQTFVPTWSSATEWSATLRLSESVNRFEIFGFDVDELLAGSVAITISRPGEEFIRGDPNGDLSVNVLDAITTVLFLFQGLQLPCPDAADFDDSGVVDVTDVLGILGYLFSHEALPLPPFPGAGIDPTEDAMGCRRG